MAKESIDEINFAEARRNWVINELPIILEVLKDIMGHFEPNKYPKWTWEILERYYKCHEWKLDPNTNLTSVWADTFIKDGKLLEKLGVIPETYGFNERIKDKKAEQLVKVWEAVIRYWWEVWNILDN